MDIFGDIIGGFSTLFSDPFAIWFVFLAAFVGIVFGALPGLTAAAAIAMMLPILIAYNEEIGGLAGLAFLYVIGRIASTYLRTEASGGGAGITTGVTRIASATRPRGEWAGRRYSSMRVCCASNAALVHFIPWG